MEDKESNDRHHDDENSDDESDGAQFISIKVTNPDGVFNDEPVDTEAVVIKPKKTVQMVDTTPSRSVDEHHEHVEHHPKLESPFHELGKNFFLVFIWLMMIFYLATTPEKKIAKRQLVLPIEGPKIYDFPVQPSGTLVHVTLQAPFLPNPHENKRKASNRSVLVDTRNKDNTIVIFLRTVANEIILTPNRTFYVHKPEDIDEVNATKVEFTFDMGEDNELHEDDVVQAVIQSNFSKSNFKDIQEMPIIFSVDFTPINKPVGVLFAAFTLILLYALIVWEVSNLFAVMLSTE